VVAVLSLPGCFNPPSYSVEKTIPLPDSLSGLSGWGMDYSAYDNRILISLWDGRVLTLDAATGRKLDLIPANSPGVSTPANSRHDSAVCNNKRENKVYTASVDSTLVAVDGRQHHTLARVRLPGRAFDLIYDSNSNRLYCCGEDWVAAVDCRSDTVVGLVRTSTRGEMVRIVFCGPINKLYYLQMYPCELYRIDCGRFTIEDRTVIGYEVGQVFYNRGQDKVYCTGDGDEVAILDVTTGSVRTMVRVGTFPFALCSNSDGTRVYCANMQGSSVSVIDGIADTVVATIGVSRWPVALCYSPRRDKLYCLCMDSTISVIDCRTYRVVKELKVVTTYWPSMLYDSAIDRVFCIAGSEGDCVAAIDARRDSVLRVTHLAGRITELVHDPANEKLYCTAWGDKADIYVVGCRTMKTRGMVKEGSEPWPSGIFSHPYIAYVKRGKGIAIVNTDDDYVIGTVDLSKEHEDDVWHPNSFAYVPKHRRLFVARRNSSVDIFREDTVNRAKGE